MGVFNTQFEFDLINQRFQECFKSEISQTNYSSINFYSIYFLLFFKFLLISSSLSFINLFWIKVQFICLTGIKFFCICALLTFIHYLIILNRTGSIEKKSSKPSSCQSFSVCHWNLNRILTYKCMKLCLWQAFIIVQNFDVICLSEARCLWESWFEHFTRYW